MTPHLVRVTGGSNKIFGIDASGALWVRFEDSGSTWEKISPPSGCPIVDCYTQSEGERDVVRVLDANGHLFQLRWFHPDRWLWDSLDYLF